MMLTDEKLLNVAEGLLPQMTQFLRELVQLRSVNGREGEGAVAQRVLAEAQALGLDGELFGVVGEVGERRPNVLASWGVGRKGFAIIAHTDTVAEGDAAAWSSPPFAGELVAGRMVGRGTGDNKAGLACGLYALTILRDYGLLDPAEVRVLLAGVVDEESGATSRLGVRHLLDSGKLPVQGAIYAYASDIVCVGHRGLLRLRLTAQGQATHSGSEGWSRGEGGVNAVTGLAEVLLALEKLEFETADHPAFDHLGCTITPGTMMQGGVFESMVPATATAVVDVRLMPKQEVGELLTAVSDIIEQVCQRRAGLTVALFVKNQLPAAAIEQQHPLATIAQQHAEAMTGKRWPIRGAGPANEGYMLIGAGIPTLCGFGPTGGNAHGVDEWVEVASLATTTAVFAATIRDYLTFLSG